MKREERYKLLMLFADGAEHTWFETINLGVRSMKIHQYSFEKLFRKALAYDLIKRVDTSVIKDLRLQSSYVITWEMFNYQITDKGDQCFRGEQLSRGGDYDYFTKYDRSISGQYGVDHFAPLPKGLRK